MRKKYMKRFYTYFLAGILLAGNSPLAGIGAMEKSNLMVRDVKAAGGLIELTDLQRLAADVNRDNTVNATDALQILKYAGGLITEF